MADWLPFGSHFVTPKASQMSHKAPKMRPKVLRMRPGLRHKNQKKTSGAATQTLGHYFCFMVDWTPFGSHFGQFRLHFGINFAQLFLSFPSSLFRMRFKLFLHRCWFTLGSMFASLFRWFPNVFSNTFFDQSSDAVSEQNRQVFLLNSVIAFYLFFFRRAFEIKKHVFQNIESRSRKNDKFEKSSRQLFDIRSILAKFSHQF